MALDYLFDLPTFLKNNML